jgi:hypothetical protein
MRRRTRGNTGFAATCLVALSAEMIACLTVGWCAGLRQAQAADSVLSPAEVIALRFPDELLQTDATQPRDIAAADPATSSAASEVAALFSPYPTDTLVAVQPTASQAASMQLASLTQSASTAPPATPAQVAAATAKLSAPVRHAANNRPGAVLSDGQIAAIKQRLKLTPDQQQMWPAVEAALRGLTYAKQPRSRVQDTRVAEIDPASTEVQQLTSAAFPLVMSFSDDQKRELNVLAHVAGLEQLVPKF